jgi:hypothetical protein
MATEIEVRARRDIPSPDPTRAGKLDTAVFYVVVGAPGRVRFVTVPKEKWSKDAELAAIRDAERRQAPPAGTDRYTL